MTTSSPAYLSELLAAQIPAGPTCHSSPSPHDHSLYWRREQLATSATIQLHKVRDKLHGISFYQRFRQASSRMTSHHIGLVCKLQCLVNRLVFLDIKRRVIVAVFDCRQQIKGTRRRWYHLRWRRTLLIFSHVVLHLLTTHIGIVSVSVYSKISVNRYRLKMMYLV